MEELKAYRARLIEQAGEQPARLKARLEAFGAGALHAPLEPGGWNPHQVVSHVRDVELHAFLPRIRSMLAEEQPLLPYFDEGEWMATHYDPHEPLEELLGAFAGARRDLLAALAAAGEAGWSRDGRHPTQGVRTVQWWFEYSVKHTEEHLRQLAGE